MLRADKKRTAARSCHLPADIGYLVVVHNIHATNTMHRPRLKTTNRQDNTKERRDKMHFTAVEATIWLCSVYITLHYNIVLSFISLGRRYIFLCSVSHPQKSGTFHGCLGSFDSGP